MAPKGKHAFVTGGGSGIGLAVATALADAGWQVTIAGRNGARLQAAAGTAKRFHMQAVDVTEPETVRAAIGAAANVLGPVALLVNNAGGVQSAPFEKTNAAAWRWSIDLNLMGTVYCTQAVLPQMRANGWGRIVSIASTAGLIGFRYVSPYVAAKHAVVGLTKALALELAKTGITVNAICPGYVDTDLVASAVKAIRTATGRSPEDALGALVASNPQGRLVKPEEIAAAALWLASDDAAAVNGIALPVAGGEVG